MTDFEERAEMMGLNTDLSFRGIYQYSDKYSSVVYRELETSIEVPSQPHPTDGKLIPLLAIFTKAPNQVDFQYTGCVSTLYKFIGNDVLNQRVRDSINSIGMPILKENTILWNMNCRMRNEMIIQSSKTTSQSGDVLPVIIVNNSYNGTRAASLSFGIAIDEQGSVFQKTIFAFSLGEMKQIHLDRSTTHLTSAISSYMQIFSENITDMISDSFNSTLSENEMLSVLDIIEGVGKNRRKKISQILTDLNPPIKEGEKPPLPSAWQVFLAIARYSSLEPNLNCKRLLENAAESVLVMPMKMLEVLDKIRQ